MRVVRVDPYHPVVGLLLPQLTQRMLDYAKQLTPELNSQIVVRNFMAALWEQSHDVMLLAFVDDSGKVAGHCAAAIQPADDGTRVIVVRLCRADGNVGDAMQLAMELLDQWGKLHEAKAMAMVTSRSDKDWQKRAGFKEYRRILIRQLGAAEEPAAV